MARSCSPLLGIGIAPVAVGLGQLRVEANGLREVKNGGVEIALATVGIAPIVIGLGRLRCRMDGLREVGNGHVEIALLIG